MPVTTELLAEIKQELETHQHCLPAREYSREMGIAHSAEIVGFHRGLFWMRTVIQQYQREED